MGIVGGNEGFFAVQDGGIGAAAVILLADLSGAEIHLGAVVQRRMGICIEVGVGEIGEFGLVQGEFDQGKAVGGGQVLTGGLFEVLELGIQVGKSGMVDVEGIRQAFPYWARLAQLGDGGVRDPIHAADLSGCLLFESPLR